MNNEPLTEQSPEFIEVGTITSPQGLKGELRVYSESDFPERFTKAGKRWLKHPKTGEINEVQLLGGRHASKNLYVIRLDKIGDRNMAETLRDYKFLADKSDRPKLGKDEYHVADLIGAEIYHQSTGENIGVVVDFYTAGNDLLEIRLHQQPQEEEKVERDLSQISRRSKRKKYRPKSKKPKTIFIPLVKEIVPIVDLSHLSHRRIEISPPDGLLEIYDD